MKMVIKCLKFGSQEWLSNLVRYIYLFIPPAHVWGAAEGIQQRIGTQVCLWSSAASTVDGSNICSSWQSDLGQRPSNIVGQIDRSPGTNAADVKGSASRWASVENVWMN